MSNLRKLSLDIFDTQKAINELQLKRLKQHMAAEIIMLPPQPGMEELMESLMVDDSKYRMQEPDHEGDMALTELAAIADKASAVMDMIDENSELPAWVQSKITQAAHFVNTVHDYVKYSRR
jgi:hypothetical protein